MYKDKVTRGNRAGEKLNSFFFSLHFSRGSIYSLPDVAPDQSISWGTGRSADQLWQLPVPHAGLRCWALQAGPGLHPRAFLETERCSSIYCASFVCVCVCVCTRGWANEGKVAFKCFRHRMGLCACSLLGWFWVVCFMCVAFYLFILFLFFSKSLFIYCSALCL